MGADRGVGESVEADMLVSLSRGFVAHGGDAGSGIDEDPYTLSLNGSVESSHQYGCGIAGAMLPAPTCLGATRPKAFAESAANSKIDDVLRMVNEIRRVQSNLTNEEECRCAITLIETENLGAFQPRLIQQFTVTAMVPDAGGWLGSCQPPQTTYCLGVCRTITST